MEKQLERMIKVQAPHSNKAYYIHNSNHGMYGVCNGVMLMMTKEQICPLDEDSRELQSVNKIVNDIVRDGKEIEYPTLKEIKEEITKLVGRKRTVPVLYSFGKGLPVVNALYLREIVEFIGDDAICYMVEPKAPLVFRIKNKICLVCPVNAGNKIPKGFKLSIGG